MRTMQEVTGFGNRMSCGGRSHHPDSSICTHGRRAQRKFTGVSVGCVGRIPNPRRESSNLSTLANHRRRILALRWSCHGLLSQRCGVQILGRVLRRGQWIWSGPSEGPVAGSILAHGSLDNLDLRTDQGRTLNRASIGARSCRLVSEAYEARMYTVRHRPRQAFMVKLEITRDYES